MLWGSSDVPFFLEPGLAVSFPGQWQEKLSPPGSSGNSSFKSSHSILTEDPLEGSVIPPGVSCLLAPLHARQHLGNPNKGGADTALWQLRMCLSCSETAVSMLATSFCNGKVCLEAKCMTQRVNCINRGTDRRNRGCYKGNFIENGECVCN